MDKFKIKYTFGKSDWKELKLNNEDEYNIVIKVFSELSKNNSNFDYGDEEKPEYLRSIKELEKYNLYFIALEKGDTFLHYKCLNEYDKLLSEQRQNVLNISYTLLRLQKNEIFKLLNISDKEKLQWLFNNTGGFSRTGIYWAPF